MTRLVPCSLALILACGAPEREPANPAVQGSQAAPAPSPAAPVPSHGDDAPHTPTGAGAIGLPSLGTIGCRAPRLGSERVAAALEDLTLEGRRSEEVVRRVLTRHLERFAGCVEAVAGAKPVPEGSFAFRLQFAAAGRQRTRATLVDLSPTVHAARSCLRRWLGYVIIPAEDPALGPAQVSARVRFWPRPPGESEPVPDCARILP